MQIKREMSAWNLRYNFWVLNIFQSDGIARSYTLASQYTKEAVKQMRKLSASPERDALISITHKVLERRKWTPR